MVAKNYYKRDYEILINYNVFAYVVETAIMQFINNRFMAAHFNIRLSEYQSTDNVIRISNIVNILLLF